MAETCYLGVDLGAESGRVMAGLFDGQKVRVGSCFFVSPTGPRLDRAIRSAGTSCGSGRKSKRGSPRRPRSLAIGSFRSESTLGSRLRPPLTHRREGSVFRITTTRSPHERRSRPGLQPRPEAGDLRRDGPAVHGVQLAVSTAGPSEVERRPARPGRPTPAHARLLSCWCLSGMPRRRIHQRDDHASVFIRLASLAMVVRHAPQVRAADRHVSGSGAAGDFARPSCGISSPTRTGLKRIEVVTPGDARHTGAAVAAVPTEKNGSPQLGLYQLGNLVG